MFRRIARAAGTQALSSARTKVSARRIRSALHRLQPEEGGAPVHFVAPFSSSVLAPIPRRFRLCTCRLANSGLRHSFYRQSPEAREWERIYRALEGKMEVRQMRRKQFTPEKVIGLLRQAEVELAQGKRVGEVCRGLGISEQSYYRWRSEYGGLKLAQARRMKDLEKENGRLKKAVAELTLDKQILKEALEGNF